MAGDWGWGWLAGAGWNWLGLAGAGWGWLELAGAGWGWLGLAGAGWGWLGLPGAGWLYLKINHSIKNLIIGIKTLTNLMCSFYTWFQHFLAILLIWTLLRSIPKLIIHQ